MLEKENIEYICFCLVVVIKFITVFMVTLYINYTLLSISKALLSIEFIIYEALFLHENPNRNPEFSCRNNAL